MSVRWTPEAIRALGVTTDIETAGSVLGYGATKARELARRGEWPTPVLRNGVRYVVPVMPLLRLLGIEDDGGPVAETGPHITAVHSAATNARGRRGTG